jgi:hypothetical protein
LLKASETIQFKSLKTDKQGDSDVAVIIWIVAVLVIIFNPAGCPAWFMFICWVIVLIPVIIVVGFVALIIVAALLS